MAKKGKNSKKNKHRRPTGASGAVTGKETVSYASGELQEIARLVSKHQMAIQRAVERDNLSQLLKWEPIIRMLEKCIEDSITLDFQIPISATSPINFLLFLLSKGAFPVINFLASHEKYRSKLPLLTPNGELCNEVHTALDRFHTQESPLKFTIPYYSAVVEANDALTKTFNLCCNYLLNVVGPLQYVMHPNRDNQSAHNETPTSICERDSSGRGIIYLREESDQRPRFGLCTAGEYPLKLDDSPLYYFTTTASGLNVSPVAIDDNNQLIFTQPLEENGMMSLISLAVSVLSQLVGDPENFSTQIQHYHNEKNDAVSFRLCLEFKKLSSFSRFSANLASYGFSLGLSENELPGDKEDEKFICDIQCNQNNLAGMCNALLACAVRNGQFKTKKEAQLAISDMCQYYFDRNKLTDDEKEALLRDFYDSILSQATIDKIVENEKPVTMDEAFATFRASFFNNGEAAEGEAAAGEAAAETRPTL